MKLLALLCAISACAFADNGSCNNATAAQVDFTGTTVTIAQSYSQAIHICSVRLTVPAGTPVDMTFNTTPQLKLQSQTSLLDGVLNGNWATAVGTSLTLTISTSAHVTGGITYYRAIQ